MPFLRIETNRELGPEARDRLLAEASRRTAELLGKPERYVMVALHEGVDMRFAGSAGPLAYAELKSLGLPGEQTPQLSAALCELLADHLGVAQDRIYIEFASPERHMWGWDARTF